MWVLELELRTVSHPPFLENPARPSLTPSHIDWSHFFHTHSCPHRWGSVSVHTCELSWASLQSQDASSSEGTHWLCLQQWRHPTLGTGTPGSSMTTACWPRGLGSASQFLCIKPCHLRPPRCIHTPAKWCSAPSTPAWQQSPKPGWWPHRPHFSVSLLLQLNFARKTHPTVQTGVSSQSRYRHLKWTPNPASHTPLCSQRLPGLVHSPQTSYPAPLPGRRWPRVTAGRRQKPRDTPVFLSLLLSQPNFLRLAFFIYFHLNPQSLLPPIFKLRDDKYS